LKFLRFLFSGSISSPCFKLHFQLCVHLFTKALFKAPSSPAGHKKGKGKRKGKQKGRQGRDGRSGRMKENDKKINGSRIWGVKFGDGF
jgi:hypothetical protein